MPEPYVEPWMRGTRLEMDPIAAAVLYSFEHAREDLEKWTADLAPEQLWARPGECASVGFHIRHIAGSVDRLLTYACGEMLSEAQKAALKSEHEGGMSRQELLGHLAETVARAAEIVRGFDPREYSSLRHIGRKRIPAPLGTLLVHIAEHTQRHVGEAIVTSKVVRGLAR